MAHEPITTDCILLQGTLAAPAQAGEPAARSLAGTAHGPAFGEALTAAAGLGCRLTTTRFAWAAATGRFYVYVDLSRRRPVSRSALAALRDAAQAVLGPGIESGLGPGLAASRLVLALDRPGASHGQRRRAHYAVEMDPAEGWADEIFRWYDQEHMPGLAAVAGNIHSRRYLNHDGGPLSLACYDLATPEVLGCPAWLQVRATAWSDITRPHFTHTLRTLFATIDPGDGG